MLACGPVRYTRGLCLVPGSALMMLLLAPLQLLNLATGQVLYVSKPLPWYHALLNCQHVGHQLSVARNSNLTEFAPLIASSGGAWLGGRRVFSPWLWADNQPLYTSYGCFHNDVVVPHVLDVRLKVLDVFDCFSSCGTLSVALRLDRCVCLKDVPDTSLLLREGNCSRICPANFHNGCGDVYTYSVYQRDMLPYIIGPRPLSENTSQTSYCGYLSASSNRSTTSLLFETCGNNSGSWKQRVCQQCLKDKQLPACTLMSWPDLSSWDEAASFCREQQMTLATPAGGGDLVAQISQQQQFWVGLRNEMVLSWIDGTSIEHEHFNQGLLSVDGNCVSVGLGPEGVLRFQLENCSTGKPYLCDLDNPDVYPTAPESSKTPPSLGTVTASSVAEASRSTPTVVTTTTQPPSTTTQPPSTTTQPPSTTTQPPSTTTQPPSTTTQPPSTTTQPPSTSTQPPSTTTQPPSTSTQPPSTTTQPPSTTTQPPSTTTQPPSTTTQPPSTLILTTPTQPPSTPTQPHSTPIQPPSTTTQPPSTTTQPPTQTVTTPSTQTNPTVSTSPTQTASTSPTQTVITSPTQTASTSPTQTASTSPNQTVTTPLTPVPTSASLPDSDLTSVVTATNGTSVSSTSNEGQQGSKDDKIGQNMIPIYISLAVCLALLLVLLIVSIIYFQRGRLSKSAKVTSRHPPATPTEKTSYTPTP